MRLVVVGATGAVGTEILRILDQRHFPVDELVPVASARSAGRRVAFKGAEVEVVALEEAVFNGADVALFDVPDDVSLRWAPVAASRGAVVVDNSAAFRMAEGVPLIVPEINGSQVGDLSRNIIASPNCTTLAMVLPLAVLHAQARLVRVLAASYQAASGAGQSGIDELWEQIELVVKEPDAARVGAAGQVLEPGSVFAHPIAMNVIPQCGSFREAGYTSEELKLCHETRKILSLPELPVTATCVRVPVVTGHGVAVHAQFSNPITAQRARELLAKAPGIEVRDNPHASEYPTPLEAAGTDACYVGRIRQDLFDQGALEFFCAADNLRKGAALNTVQIAELLVTP